MTRPRSPLACSALLLAISACNGDDATPRDGEPSVDSGTIPDSGIDGQTTSCADDHPAQLYRAAAGPVEPQPGDLGTFLVEAEEMRGGCANWTPLPYGTNYYASTFADTFMSRAAYLGAPEQGTGAVATIDLDIKMAGRYLALVRHEAPYRFESQFHLRIEQNGETKLDRLYGAQTSTKIWPFGEGLQASVAWPWGAVENVVWEGRDAYVDLAEGPATMSLIADAQPSPAARRNVDAILLTTDEAQVADRIASENYLPLDGWLTQAGDLYLQVTNHGTADLALKVWPGVEHSPYWVHTRRWAPIELTLPAGQASDWLEVGSLLDALNGGQWEFDSGDAPDYHLDFGVHEADGSTTSIASFDVDSRNYWLAYEADTRWSRRLRPQDDVLDELLAVLEATPQAGRAPSQTIVYGYSFDAHPGDAAYTAKRDAFHQELGIIEPDLDAVSAGAPSGGYLWAGYMDATGLQAQCDDMIARGIADRVSVVTLGDEIGLTDPPPDSDVPFQTWLAGLGLTFTDVEAAAVSWSDVHYDPDPGLAANDPMLFYWSQRYRHHYGVDAQAQLTAILKACLPNAGIGANYSPHSDPAFLGTVAQWVSMFRDGGMTMPWSEDYIWQIPIGSQQMNSINLDLFRDGLRDLPDEKIQFYVMPHWPGNTPNSWRRQFYGDLMHGMKIVNFFEIRPRQVAYTENYSDLPQMYLDVRRGLYELGTFEDIVQGSQVRPGAAALWFSETSDIWSDTVAPFAAEKRSLYIGIRHQQLPLDALDDGAIDALGAYSVLYLTDRHVSRAASQAIADWVAGGGRLFATAGAGMADEFNQPNTVMQPLLGIVPDPVEIEDSPVRFEKQDLPFATPVDTVTWQADAGDVTFSVYSARMRFALDGAEAKGTFADGSPAIATKTTGSGDATICGFLPGLSYFQPAIPMRPVDRGTTDDAMDHFIPTAFDPGVSALIGSPAADVARPVTSSEPLVETGLLESADGTVLPLVNWSGAPIVGLQVRTSVALPTGSVTLASGGAVTESVVGSERVFTFALDVADALVFRP